MFDFSFFLAIVPLIVFLILLLWGRMSLLKVSAITLALTILFVFFYWQIFPDLLLTSGLKGFWIALDIFIIIFGAIFFLEVLEDLKIIGSITHYLESFSKDYRVQVIILAWLFENFLEGTAGFGTPAAVVAPLLVGLGLSPLKAVVVALLGNSASVVFGAAGAPIRVGFAGLDTVGVPEAAALFNCVGFIVPAFMLWVISAGKPERKKQFMEGLPFAIWAGIAFVVPSVFMVPFGQEFPSILGSIIGLLLVLISVRLKIFTPKNIRPSHVNLKMANPLSIFKAFFPYLLLIVFLIAGKFLLGEKSFLVNFVVSHKFSLFNPGLAFIAVGLPIAIFWNRKKKITFGALGFAAKRALEPFLVIVCMSAMVQIMISASQNYSGLSSPIVLIAKVFENNLLPLWAPIVGAFGNFLTGSATISNILFGSFLSAAAQVLSLPATKILALALVGAAAGNMIALADILAAETVVRIKNRERDVLKGVFIPCLIYVLLTGVLGMLII